MRQQYHPRIVGSDTHIWDIHRLVELSKDFPVVEVPLSSIAELDENYWFDDNIPTCRAVAGHFLLMRDVDVRYPIILFSDGRVADGMHRACRALVEGKTHIKAVRFETDPAPDYINISLDDLPY